MHIRQMTRVEFEHIVETRADKYGDIYDLHQEFKAQGRTLESTRYHIHELYRDWRIQKKWETDTAKIMGMYAADGDFMGCFAMTTGKSKPIVSTLRHLVVLDKYRAGGNGYTMFMKFIEESLLGNSVWIKWFADPTSKSWYEYRFGACWVGSGRSTHCPLAIYKANTDFAALSSMSREEQAKYQKEMLLDMPRKMYEKMTGNLKPSSECELRLMHVDLVDKKTSGLASFF